MGCNVGEIVRWAGPTRADGQSPTPREEAIGIGCVTVPSYRALLPPLVRGPTDQLVDNGGERYVLEARNVVDQQSDDRPVRFFKCRSAIDRSRLSALVESRQRRW